MKINSKYTSLAMISILILMAALSAAVVNAQSDATVVVNTSDNGTTDVTGTQTYPDGTTVTITATSNDGFTFQQWLISPSDNSGDVTVADNPVSFAVTGGVTYTVTPTFVTPQPIPGLPLPTDLTNSAIIVIYASAGGIVSPAPGTYALANAASFNLKATANNGWRFDHWTICGNPTPHGTALVNWTPTDNPYNVNHGYGDTYRYQAVFVPVSTSATPTPTTSPSGSTMGLSNETYIIIALVVVIVIILIAFGVYAARRKK